MMMFCRTTKYLLLALLGLGATCERPVDLPFDLPDSKLVIVSNFTLLRQLEVRVSRSQSILDEGLGEYLSDAKVELYAGGQLLEQLKLVIPPGSGRLPPYYTTHQLSLQEGVEYLIRVEAEGFEPVSAVSTIPPPVPISSFNVFNGSVSQGNLPTELRYDYSVSFNFVDPPDEKNYYHLNFYQQVKEYINIEGDTTILRELLHPIFFSNSTDNNMINAYFSGGVLLEDNPFRTGLSFNAFIELEPDFELLGKVFVELRTVTEEYYLFHASLSKQQNQSEGPFNEPVIVYNNIDNGQGIFAGYNISTDSMSVVIH